MRSIEPIEVGSLLRPGMRVWVAGGSNEPRTLVDGLARACDADPRRADGVTFLQFPLPGMNRFDFSSLSADARMETFFLTPDLGAGHAAGRVRFLPMHMRHAYDYLGRGLDLALIQCTRDAAGRLRAGPNVDFHQAAIETAAVVVAELNTTLPAPAGAPVIDESAIDYLATSATGPATLPAARLDDVSRSIGARVAALIGDGDCIQTGIGAIPAAILAALSDKNDIGLHGGLLDDGGRALIDKGVATGAAKSYMRGVHAAGMLLGTAALFEWASECRALKLCGANVTHDSQVIARLDNFVSINSAVEVDLDGQVNAEVVQGRQISGVGGAVDFMRAARMSAGGRSIVAMTRDRGARQGVQDRPARRHCHRAAFGRGHRGNRIRRGQAFRRDASRAPGGADRDRASGLPGRAAPGGDGGPLTTVDACSCGQVTSEACAGPGRAGSDGIALPFAVVFDIANIEYRLT